VALARDKVRAFLQFRDEGVACVPWTTDSREAAIWLSKGAPVVVRHSTTGQGGSGIEIVESGAIPLDAPLYTKYVKRKSEFRVHVFRGAIIDVQEKKKRRGVEVDYRVRNFDNGWVFCREDVHCPGAVGDAAIDAVRVLGLDFGAVDVGWNERKQEAYVFEVNTAPGIEGTTLEKYSNKIKEILA
jgi:D-alanine-D-alanine ligase-like ATP-grasp enzyme